MPLVQFCIMFQGLHYFISGKWSRFFRGSPYILQENEFWGSLFIEELILGDSFLPWQHHTMQLLKTPGTLFTFWRGTGYESTTVAETFEIGVCQRFVCMCKCTHGRVCSPRKIVIRHSETASEATFGPKRHYSYHCYLYVFACVTLMYRRPHAMQWLLLKSLNLWVSSAEWSIGLMSLG